MGTPGLRHTLRVCCSCPRVPNDIVEILHWANVEDDIPFASFIKSVVEEKILDINRWDKWDNSDCTKTTLLLSEIEWRRIDNVKLLLSLGADVSITSEYGNGVIDMILAGHSWVDRTRPEECVALLNLILPCRPSTYRWSMIPLMREELNGTYKDCNDGTNNGDDIALFWSGYTKSEALIKILAPMLAMP